MTKTGGKKNGGGKNGGGKKGHGMQQGRGKKGRGKTATNNRVDKPGAAKPKPAAANNRVTNGRAANAAAAAKPRPTMTEQYMLNDQVIACVRLHNKWEKVHGHKTDPHYGDLLLGTISLAVMIANYQDEDEVILPFDHKYIEDLYKRFADPEDWNWSIPPYKITDMNAGHGPLQATMYEDTKKAWKNFEKAWKMGRFTSVVFENERPSGELITAEDWGPDFSKMGRFARDIWILNHDLSKGEAVELIKDIMYERVKSKAQAEKLIKTLIREKREALGLEALQRLSFSREAGWFKNGESALRTIVDVVAHLGFPSYKNPRMAFDRLVKWYNEIPVKQKPKFSDYSWIAHLVMPETQQEAEARANKERKAAAKKASNNEKDGLDEFGTDNESDDSTNNDNDAAMDNSSTSLGDNSNNAVDDVSVESTAPISKRKAENTPTSSPTREDFTNKLPARKAPPKKKAALNEEKEVDVIDLTGIVDDIKKANEGFAATICCNKKKLAYNGPVPKSENSSAYMKPDTDWIRRYSYKFNLAQKLAADLVINYEINVDPKLMKAPIRNNRAELAARKLGFLPPGKNQGIDHVKNSTRVWLHGMLVDSMIPTMATLESALSGDSASHQQLEVNFKKALIYIDSLSADDKAAKKVLKQILMELK